MLFSVEYRLFYRAFNKATAYERAVSESKWWLSA